MGQVLYASAALSRGSESLHLLLPLHSMLPERTEGEGQVPQQTGMTER